MPTNYGRPTPILFDTDSDGFDAFGRLKVSSPFPMFDNMSNYPTNPFFWETDASGGSITHVPAENCNRLSTGGTTDTNYALRQTKQYLRYQPGRSLNIEATFKMGAVVTNGIARIGYFDDSDGVFLERDGETLNIVLRSSTSGSAVETRIPQTSWNIDKLDGNGASGITIDVTKTQILTIQLQYLGVGRVQVGFNIDGDNHFAHEFRNANNLTTVYMSSGCLPFRAKVVNNGTASGTLTMDTICVSVSSGGMGAEKIRWSASNGITAKATSTTLIPILSIRAAQYFGGIDGAGSLVNRGHVEAKTYSVHVTGQSHEIQVILNGTLTSPSWTSANPDYSIADYDVSATGITGGYAIGKGYIGAAVPDKVSEVGDISSIYPLVYSGLGNQDIMTIAVRTVTSTGTALASLTWDEQY